MSGSAITAWRFSLFLFLLLLLSFTLSVTLPILSTGLLMKPPAHARSYGPLLGEHASPRALTYTCCLLCALVLCQPYIMSIINMSKFGGLFYKLCWFLCYNHLSFRLFYAGSMSLPNLSVSNSLSLFPCLSLSLHSSSLCLCFGLCLSIYVSDSISASVRVCVCLSICLSLYLSLSLSSTSSSSSCPPSFWSSKTRWLNCGRFFFTHACLFLCYAICLFVSPSFYHVSSISYRFYLFPRTSRLFDCITISTSLCLHLQLPPSLLLSPSLFPCFLSFPLPLTLSLSVFLPLFTSLSHPLSPFLHISVSPPSAFLSIPLFSLYLFALSVFLIILFNMHLSILIIWKLYPFASLYRPNYRSYNLQVWPRCAK